MTNWSRGANPTLRRRCYSSHFSWRSSRSFSWCASRASPSPSRTPQQQHEHSSSPSSDWSAAQYLKFGDDRTRPVHDLIARIPLHEPRRIVDLGCGPGNSTAELIKRFPRSHVTGMDSSPDMIKRARSTLPDIEFTIGDLMSYDLNHGGTGGNARSDGQVTQDNPENAVDLYFSNAVLHWLPYESRMSVISNFLRSQRPGGVFAFQIPDNDQEPSHVAMADTASDANEPWSSSKLRRFKARDPFQSVQEIYDALRPICGHLDIWHTHYHHALDNHEAIVEWVKGSGLRPYLVPLSQEEKSRFLEAYLSRLEKLYPVSQDGRVILRYPRLFVVAQRA